MEKRLLFAGGCHVGGYPFDFNESFASISARLLNLTQDSVKVMDLIHLRQVERVKFECFVFKPDYLILQLGNFETSRGFSVMFEKDKPRSRSDDVRAAEVSDRYVDDFFQKDIKFFKWNFINFIKLYLSIIFGNQYFSLDNFKTLLERYCYTVSGLNLPRVVLMSPLPCADRVFMRNRLRVNSLFAIEAEKYGFIYLNVLDKLSSDSSASKIFHDAFHLNEKGHSLLGDLVYKCIADDVAAHG